jgi:hypothetical protein
MSSISIKHLSLAPEMVSAGPDDVLKPNAGQITGFLETSFSQ